ncbi:hypothetical protein CR513_07427, partial [Mucuna pruriens]
MYEDTKSIEEYFKEKEVTLIREQVVESQEAMITRFLHGLNRDIQDIIELHKYTSLSTLVHQASKVELQLKRHGKRTYRSTSSNWKDYITSQFLNKRTIILRENRDIENESSLEETLTSRSKGGYSSGEAPYEGDLLMVRRLMSTFVGED